MKIKFLHFMQIGKPPTLLDEGKVGVRSVTPRAIYLSKLDKDIHSSTINK